MRILQVGEFSRVGGREIIKNPLLEVKEKEGFIVNKSILKINELNDNSFVRNIIKSGKNIISNTNSEEKKILAIVDKVLSK